MAHINVCGWTNENNDLRCALIKAIDADITCVSETHLSGQNVLKIEGYMWLGYNRQEIHRNAPKASGGVGIFIKEKLLQNYNAEIVDKSFDGILGVKFSNKATDYTFVVYASYLPPERSTRGRDAQSFFSHVLAQMYLFYDSDAIFVVGDLNSRIGNIHDASPDFDGIPQRTVLDKTINQHGHDFCEFLIEAKMCTLNGRFDNSLDGYTSISGRGSAVVDYKCVPHDIFKQCQTFEVIPVNSVIQEHNLQNLLGHRSKAPDHAFILTEFDTGLSFTDTNSNLHPDNNVHLKCEPKYKLNRIPDDFMQSDLSRNAILEIIRTIEGMRESQNNVDAIYERLTDTIINEMNDKIPKYDTSKRTQKRHRTYKPYWNDSLSDLWNTMRLKEREFLKCDSKRSARRTALRQDFKVAQNNFDKSLRKAERTYRRTVANDIESMSTSNPNDFGDKVKHLGPRKDRSIPVEIHDDSGHVIRDENIVFEKWKGDFENLYSSSSSCDFDQMFYDTVKSHKRLLEENMLDPLFISNPHINSNITLDEVAAAIMKAKKLSACGIDKIPYDVLKFPPVIAVIHQLFQLIFDTSIIPSVWRQSIICPILKDPSSDRSVPMNYRGISLLSCISKLYSSILNKRITKYLEENNILAEEQNGFRTDRSCEDHVFTLNSVIRNNTTVFAAFIDLKKAFDFVDRNMLLYKLLQSNINGKMYDSIKNIYAHTTSCIRINKLTEWFDCKSGVRQGDCLSPTIFSLFINDLVSEINGLGLGIDLNGTNISLLLYADDICFLAKSETDLQTILDTLHNWCKKWRVLINTEKSKAVHFRKGRRKRTEFTFKIGQNVIELVETYKYLGVIFQEKSDFTQTADALATGGG